MAEYNDKEEMYHHGILGMKWGVRRYQNKDGSLTPAGRRKVARMKDEYTELTGKKLIRKPTAKTSKSSSNNSENSDKKKSIKDMSDTELREKINRLQMEKQAKNLQNDLSSNGSKFVSSVGKQVLAPAAIDAGKRLLTDLFLKIGKDTLGLNQEQSKDALSDLRKEVDELELKKRKSVVDDYFKKREQRESTNNSKSNDSKSNDSKNNTTKNNDKKESETKAKAKTKTVNPFTNEERRKNDTVVDAVWEERSTSTALVPYVNKGSSFIDELFKK